MTTKRIIVLLCALALILPMGLVGIGQLTSGGNEDQLVSGSAQDTRKIVDPATQPGPTHTTAPDAADFAGMDEPTAAGAEKALDHFFATYAYMINTGDTKHWEEVSAPECEECQQFAANSLALHAAGGWIVGGAITVDNATTTLSTVGEARDTLAASDGGNDPAPEGAASDPYASIDARYTEETATMVDDPTRESVTRDTSSGTFHVAMRHDGKRWLVTSMAVK